MMIGARLLEDGKILARMIHFNSMFLDICMAEGLERRFTGHPSTQDKQRSYSTYAVIPANEPSKSRD